MRYHLLRIAILSVAISLLTAGCIVSQSIDRAFLGMSTNRPAYHDRKVAGFILLPVAFAVDIVTLPIQAVLLMIFGDNFPFNDKAARSPAALDHDLNFQKLTDEQRAMARAELTSLVQSGAVSVNNALALCEDGHWVLIPLSAEARAALSARANAPAQERPSLARAH